MKNSPLLDLEFWIIANLYHGRQSFCISNSERELRIAGRRAWGFPRVAKTLIHHKFLEPIADDTSPLLLTSKAKRFIENRYTHGIGQKRCASLLMSIQSVLSESDKLDQVIWSEPLIRLKLIDEQGQLKGVALEILLYWLKTRDPSCTLSIKVSDWLAAVPRDCWGMIISAASCNPKAVSAIQDFLRSSTNEKHSI